MVLYGNPELPHQIYYNDIQFIYIIMTHVHVCYRKGMHNVHVYDSRLKKKKDSRDDHLSYPTFQVLQNGGTNDFGGSHRRQLLSRGLIILPSLFNGSIHYKEHAQRTKKHCLAVNSFQEAGGVASRWNRTGLIN